MTAAGGTLAVVFRENGVSMPDCRDFDLGETLLCGQAFRWRAQPEGGFLGVVRGKVCRISQLDKEIFLSGVTRGDFEKVWRDYFDLDRDYGQIKRSLSQDPTLAQAVAYAPGIRVLRQEPWEALCSFIISQNNNVKRISGVTDRLCQAFGEPLEGGQYAFPTAQRLAGCTLEALEPLRAGFRAKYILDAAVQVASGRVDLAALGTLPYDAAREQLMAIKGVGVKVADCTLLYGCGRLESFPVDVWIARVMERLFPQGLPDCAKPWAGIAQQYLFHYARTCPQALE